MAGTRGQQSDNSYFSSLLKIWDLEDVDDKILLETAAPGHSLHSGADTESWLSAEELSTNNTHICESTPLTYIKSKKPGVEDASITGIDSGSQCVLSHSILDLDSVVICVACRHSNEAGSHWCSECGTALTGNGCDCSDDDGGTSTTPSSDCGSNTTLCSQCYGEELDPIHHKVLDLSDTSNLRSIIAKPNKDLLKLSSQYDSCTRDSSSGETVCQKLRDDSADASEIQDSHAQSKKTRSNFPTHTSAYVYSNSGVFISKNTLNDDPLVLLPNNSKENEQGCKTVSVHQRHWDSSSTYMWRKPATLRSKVSLPSDSATCSAVLHNTSGAFHTHGGVSSKQDLPMDNSFNSHGKYRRASSGIPSRSVQIPHLALNSIKDVVRSVPSELHLAPAVSLLSLPDELLLIILSYLRVPQLVACLRACRRLGQIAADSSLWKCIIFNGKESCLSERVLQVAGKRQPKVIVFSHCKANITTKELQTFFKNLSDSLQSLRVDTCDFGSQTGDTILTTAILHCQHLTSIDISWTQLSDRALRFAVEHCKRLEAVSLEQTPEISLKTLKLLAKQHERWLMALRIKGKLNFIKSIIEVTTKLFEQAPNLATFAVTCTEIKEEHIQRLVTFHKLTDLEIQCTSITETAVRCLSQIPLESLTLTALLPLSATCLAHISEMNTLRHFSTSSIDDSGIQTLCSGRLHLESLRLSKCDITEIGLQTIAMNDGLTNSLTSLKIDSYRNQQKSNEAFMLLIRKCIRLKTVTPGTH